MPILTLEIDVIQRECLPDWQTFEKGVRLAVNLDLLRDPIAMSCHVPGPTCKVGSAEVNFPYLPSPYDKQLRRARIHPPTYSSKQSLSKRKCTLITTRMRDVPNTFVHRGHLIVVDDVAPFHIVPFFRTFSTSRC